MTTISGVAGRIEIADDAELLGLDFALANVSTELRARICEPHQPYIGSKCREYLEQIEGLQTAIAHVLQAPTYA